MGIQDRLPSVRGKLLPDARLADVTWFRVGGPADALFMPADAEDLSDFLKALDADIPVTVIGVGSNLLVRDGGIEGVVIRLGKPFAKIEAASGTQVRTGTAALDVTVAVLVTSAVTSVWAKNVADWPGGIVCASSSRMTPSWSSTRSCAVRGTPPVFVTV